MEELLVKTACCLFIKSSTQFSAVKGFYIYDISILISVRANCVDSIYVNLGGLVV